MHSGKQKRNQKRTDKRDGYDSVYVELVAILVPEIDKRNRCRSRKHNSCLIEIFEGKRLFAANKHPNCRNVKRKASIFLHLSNVG